MQSAKARRSLTKHLMLAVAIAVVLASPMWATIKVGNDPIASETSRLRSAGWTVNFDKRLSMSAMPDKEVLQRTANKLVAVSVHNLSKEDADKISTETKYAIARIARETFERAILEERQTIESGRIGSVLYKVGAWRYKEDVYRLGSKVEGGGGLAPFVALMPARRAGSRQAELSVYNIPVEAEILFDGEAMTQKGHSRRYLTPPLEDGKSYRYEIVARWRENGKEIKRSRQANVTSGDRVEVDFLEKQPIRFKWKSYTGEKKTAEACLTAYSPDRKKILKVVDKDDPTWMWVRLYDAATDKPLGPEIKLLPRITALAVAPDGKTVAIGQSPRFSKDNTLVEVWDATTGESLGAHGCVPGYWSSETPLGEIFELSLFQNGRCVLITALPRERE